MRANAIIVTPDSRIEECILKVKLFLKKITRRKRDENTCFSDENVSVNDGKDSTRQDINC